MYNFQESWDAFRRTRRILARTMIMPVILAMVNLDYRYKQSGWVNLSLEELGLGNNQTYEVHDLLADATYKWQGPRNYVELDPQKIPAHIFRVQLEADSQKIADTRDNKHGNR